MKYVIQLSPDGYFNGFAIADESPLEKGVLLIPAGCIDTAAPDVPEGKLAKWEGEWVFEDIPQPEVEPEPEVIELTYAQKRAMEYPQFTEYLDGLVKNDQQQMNRYIEMCLAVKAKYPKEI